MTRMAGLLTLLLVLVPGCMQMPVGPYPVTSYRADDVDLMALRRVVVIPFNRETPHSDYLEDMEGIFAAEMQKIQRFEVVPLDSADLVLASRVTRLRGRFAMNALIELAERYRADGFLLGTISQFRPYEPLALGMKAELVSGGTGDVLWSAEALFDCAEERTLKEIRLYHQAFGSREETPYGWRRYTISVAAFARFVCNRIVASVDCGIVYMPARN